jgi:hypothetical protein
MSKAKAITASLNAKPLPVIKPFWYQCLEDTVLTTSAFKRADTARVKPQGHGPNAFGGAA